MLFRKNVRNLSIFHDCAGQNACTQKNDFDSNFAERAVAILVVTNNGEMILRSSTTTTIAHIIARTMKALILELMNLIRLAQHELPNFRFNQMNNIK